MGERSTDSDAYDATLAPTPALDATVAAPAGLDATLASTPPPARDSRAALSLETVDPARYLHGRELARGGMGRIRVARDRRLDRDVAIKELLHDSADGRMRFEREIRVTAKLQHPSIVNVLEAGCWPSGEPFYVMKLVAGAALDRVIATRTSLEQRMALLPHLIDVVEALAFAHSRGIIHRDLKPANVLVGDFGETVVIDWGLARAVDDGAEDVGVGMTSDHGATMAGAILGTPGYMAPEQADGEALDTRADVYSLGAMMFHVLAGTQAVEARSVEEMLAKVSSGERTTLGQVAPTLPPDLVAIVEKAMALERERRYPSARELAEDLRRFEAGQLVGARMYSTWELVRRWIARHRAVLSVSLLALVTVVTMATLGLQRIFSEKRATEEQRTLADRNRVDAEDLLTYLLADVSQKLAKLGNVALREDVANTVIRYYAAHPARSVRRRVAAHAALASALIEQRDLERAISQTDEALAIAASLLSVIPGDREIRASITNLHDLEARAQVYRGQLDKALDSRREAIALQEQLLREVPSALNRRRLAELRTGVAVIEYERGDQQSALASITPAVTELQALLRVERTPGALVATWKALHVLGDIHVRLGNTEPALGMFRDALALAQQSITLDPKNVELLDQRATSSDRIAEMLTYLGRNDEARVAYERGLEFARAIADRDPANVQWQRSLAMAHAHLAGAYLPNRDYAHAVEQYQHARTVLSRLVALDESDMLLQRDLAALDIELAETQFARSEDAAAYTHARAAVERLEQVVKTVPRDALALRLLAKAYSDLGSLEVEKKALRDGVNLLVKGLATAQTLIDLDPTNILVQEEAVETAESLLDLQVVLRDARLPATAAALRAIHAALLAKDAVQYQPLVTRGRAKLDACCK